MRPPRASITLFGTWYMNHDLESKSLRINRSAQHGVKRRLILGGEIPDFLSPEEADHIIDVAYGVGFSKSDIHLDPVAKDHAKTLRSTEGHSNSSAGYFLNWDFDKDYEITKDEAMTFAKKFKYLYLSPVEVDEMIKNLDLKEFDDGKNR
ncbi:uncharacterized protein LOC110049671 [Orbicella faveolata]|uniref:uncharacterized protein LOC110049671 n=1 Tax=Orbicella faveolata TaxID=48498 RepID=UPI0009E6204B|nr:uncharacterized protein LOC110049671 [Orbicella faveolata]